VRLFPFSYLTIITLGGMMRRQVGVERKLTAILCADVYGYSRLMGGDEEATLVTQTAHRKIIDSLIEQHHGRFVNSAGDSVLADFASVVEAVNCAVSSSGAVLAAGGRTIGEGAWWVGGSMSRWPIARTGRCARAENFSKSLGVVHLLDARLHPSATE
jgi:hypothetical protein